MIRASSPIEYESQDDPLRHADADYEADDPEAAAAQMALDQSAVDIDRKKLKPRSLQFGGGSKPKPSGAWSALSTAAASAIDRSRPLVPIRGGDRAAAAAELADGASLIGLLEDLEQPQPPPAPAAAAAAASAASTAPRPLQSSYRMVRRPSLTKPKPSTTANIKPTVLNAAPLAVGSSIAHSTSNKTGNNTNGQVDISAVLEGIDSSMFDDIDLPATSRPAPAPAPAPRRAGVAPVAAASAGGGVGGAGGQRAASNFLGSNAMSGGVRGVSTGRGTTVATTSLAASLTGSRQAILNLAGGPLHVLPPPPVAAELLDKVLPEGQRSSALTPAVRGSGTAAAAAATAAGVAPTSEYLIIADSREMIRGEISYLLRMAHRLQVRSPKFPTK